MPLSPVMAQPRFRHAIRRARWGLPTVVAFVAALVAFGFAPRLARAGGIDAGFSFADCVIAPSADHDHDRLDDDCEAALAKAFEPELVFGLEETATTRLPFWASVPDDFGVVRIFFALSYLRDAGDPTFGGASSHDGDTEFIVLRVSNTTGTNWSLLEGYLSGHYETACDSGGWHDAAEFTYAGSTGGRPIVFIAEGKHANYVDLASCDAGGCYQDHCSDFEHEPLGVLPGSDLGVASHPLVDEVVSAGNHEWYWTDVVFCGWKRAPNEPRDGCVPKANTYALELATFAMDSAYLGGVGMCEACASDLDCDDWGLCVDEGQGPSCLRACDALHACPVGSACVDFAGGSSQCVPTTACSCVLACKGKACGDDGCGGSCGSCAMGEACVAGACVPSSAVCASCTEDAECGAGHRCGPSADGVLRCLALCGPGDTCADGFACTSVSGEALCQPATIPGCHDGDAWLVDGCGTPVSKLAACDQNSPCENGVCGGCVPSCDGKVCGDDACGASCGVCPSGSTCQADGSCGAARDASADAGGCGCAMVGWRERTSAPAWIGFALAVLARLGARCRRRQ
jgi:hypothetical protein